MISILFCILLGFLLGRLVAHKCSRLDSLIGELLSLTKKVAVECYNSIKALFKSKKKADKHVK